MKKSLLFLLLGCGLCLLCNACGSGSSTPPPPTATHFSVTGPAFATTGTPVSFTVTALDASNNVFTSYSGTVRFTSSDAKATLPPSSPLTMGTGNFSVTFNTLGNQTITATDSASLTGKSGAIDVVTATATTHFSVAIAAGSPTTRSSITLFVAALDAANNPSTGYSGTVQITTSDAKAILPPNAPLPNGAGNFQLTFETAGNQIVTATDTATPALTGSSATIAVTATAPPTITSGPPPNGTVGEGYNPHSVKVCVVPLPFGGCLHFENRRVFSFPLTASGGVGADTWSWAPVAPSSLPPGLNLTGSEISGTPTAPGTYQVSVTVTDSGTPSAQSSTPYSITVNKPPVPSVSGGPTPAVENQPYTFKFSASGYPPLTWSESGALPTGITFDDSNGTLSGTPTQTGSFPISITATDQFSQSSQPANFTLVVSAHGFVAAGNMTSPRALHTSTLLNGGMILITGGANLRAASTVTASAELYDSNAGTFSATGNMQTARAEHTATLLNDGRVLIAGGCSIALAGPLMSAELFDPTGATSTATGSMNTARCGHTATLLANGKVLMTGGADATSTAMASAELFDPTTNTFSTTGSLQTARKEHTATLLANGKVLVTGGIDDKSNDLDSAELYDPAAGTFTTVVGTMTAARAGHTASLFATGTDAGKVLLAGGSDATGKAQNTAELFDPVAQNFAATNNMTTAHASYTATLLPDGTVLLAGGVDATGGPTSVAELFDPSSGNFSATGSLILAREQHAATLLSNGQVLATGGQNGTSIASAEIYK